MADYQRASSDLFASLRKWHWTAKIMCWRCAKIYAFLQLKEMFTQLGKGFAYEIQTWTNPPDM